MPSSVLAWTILPASGLISPGQQFEQGGLARAIGADQPDAVAALDAQGEILDDRPLVIAFEDRMGVDHRLGLDLVARQPELGRARRPDHRRPLGAHLVELGQPALVAAPPRGYAAVEPVQF